MHEFCYSSSTLFMVNFYRCNLYNRACCKVLLIVVVQLLFSMSARSQNDFKPTFGIIDKASLEMTTYAADSTADALYLYDYGETTFAFDGYKGLVIKTKTWVRIKVLKESGLNRASVNLSYIYGSKNSERERLEDIAGFVYNLDGGRIVSTALDVKAVIDEKSMDILRSKKFNLPNVRKGSIFEYSYVKVSPVAVRNAPENWTFQGSVPIKWSEYRISIPQFIDYHITVSGYLPLHINRSEPVTIAFKNIISDKKGTAYRLVVKDAPAFVDEPFITVADDYLSQVSFEPYAVTLGGFFPAGFAETWEQIDAGLKMAEFGDVTAEVFGKEIPAALSDEKVPKLQKMNAAYTYVQKTMKWDEGTGVTPQPTLKRAYETKSGNASSINLLLVNLLRKSGIEADPAVLSTRTNGRLVKEFPSIKVFDYVVCRAKLDSTVYLLDATQRYARPGMLPGRALNSVARVISTTGTSSFIDVIPSDGRNELEVIDAEILSGDGRLKGTYEMSLSGYSALDWREHFCEKPEKLFDDQVKEWFANWETANHVILNKNDNIEAPVKFKCQFESEGQASSQDMLYIDLMQECKMQGNPLTASERLYPIDFTTPSTKSFIGKFRLPEGYKIEEIPKGESLILPAGGGRFLYQVRHDGNVVHVSCKVIIARAKYAPTEYAGLREFYDRVLKKQAEPLVIRKINN
jgi:hypothetical protein